MDYLDFPLSVKAHDADTGTFTGLASVYNVTDRQGDVVVPGAFTKSIAENGGEVTILLHHAQSRPIGTGTLTDGPAGLAIAGKLALGVTDADQAWKLMRARVLKSLSIGYDVVKSSYRRDGARLLEEIKLWEVSLVTIPANAAAIVTGLKRADRDEIDTFRRLLGQMSDLVAVQQFRRLLRGRV